MTEPPCECEGPGLCPRFGIDQQTYHWELCRGLHGEGKGERYRRKWRLALLGDPAGRPQPAPAGVPARPDFRKARVPCAHRGGVVRQGGPGCGTCSVYGCAVYGECVIVATRRAPGVRACLDCGEWLPSRESHT